MSAAHEIFSKSKEFESVQLELKWELRSDLPWNWAARLMLEIEKNIFVMCL